MAQHIVTGMVTKVERADDLVMPVVGEPDGEDRIPIEVVTLKIEAQHKGQGPEREIWVFQTGATEATGQPLLLEGDPPYRVGGRYVLLLEAGPIVTIGGIAIETERPISPEGRYHVTLDTRFRNRCRRLSSPSSSEVNPGRPLSPYSNKVSHNKARQSFLYAGGE